MFKKTAKTNTCSKHVKQAGKMNSTKKLKIGKKAKKRKSWKRCTENGQEITNHCHNIGGNQNGKSTCHEEYKKQL